MQFLWQAIVNFFTYLQTFSIPRFSQGSVEMKQI